MSKIYCISLMTQEDKIRTRTRVGVRSTGFGPAAAAAAAAAKSLQSCPTLSDPMVCSLPGSSVHGIFQARVLEWGAIAFSRFGPTSIIYEPFKLEQVILPAELVLFCCVKNCHRCCSLIGYPTAKSRTLSNQKSGWAQLDSLLNKAKIKVLMVWSYVQFLEKNLLSRSFRLLEKSSC